MLHSKTRTARGSLALTAPQVEQVFASGVEAADHHEGAVGVDPDGGGRAELALALALALADALLAELLAELLPQLLAELLAAPRIE